MVPQWPWCPSYLTRLTKNISSTPMDHRSVPRSVKNRDKILISLIVTIIIIKRIFTHICHMHQVTATKISAENVHFQHSCLWIKWYIWQKSQISIEPGQCSLCTALTSYQGLLTLLLTGCCARSLLHGFILRKPLQKADRSFTNNYLF